MTIRSTSLVTCSSRRAIEPYTKAQAILFAKGRRATLSVGISPTFFSKMLRSSRKIGDRVSALKYVLRPSLRSCNMPLCSSERSSRCRLDSRRGQATCSCTDIHDNFKDRGELQWTRGEQSWKALHQ